MSKYNFDLDLKSENSLSIIINMIKPNSRILEFGPAHGRMTKYLKENMNCIVDIVEIDIEAGQEASKYANKYFIGEEFGNIEKYIWLEKLNKEKYDYIIFADVLEHLYWPAKVLNKCKYILNDNGSIILSVPNIAHNSVLIDLMNDEFKYNELGLLDNTHIRFFTYKSLIRMLEEVGLATVNERATYSRVGQNEISNSYDSLNKDVSSQIKKREKGNIYQFIFEVKKKNYCLNTSSIRCVNLDKLSEYEFVAYIKDNDNEYTEDKTIRKNINTENINLSLDLTNYNNVKEIRIDPITSNCIISSPDIYVIKDGEKINLNIKSTNCDIKYDNNYFFSTYDPQIFIDLKYEDSREIFIRYKLINYDNQIIDKIVSLLLSMKNKNERYINEVETKLLEKQKYINEVETKLLEKEKYVNEVETKLLEKERYVNEVEIKLQEQEKYINEIEKSRGYIFLTKVKRLVGK